MTMIQRPASRGPALLVWAAAGLLAGLALAAYLSLPQVTAVSPDPAAPDLSPRTAVRLTFSQPMDTASVEAGLYFEPARPGALSWEGRTLAFTPAEAWPEAGTVTVTLAGGRSRLGLPLLGEQRWTFRLRGERLAYLSGEVPNLYVIALSGQAAPQAVTGELYGVYDYDLSPDGRFVYAARRADGGADLRAAGVDGSAPADLLLCPEAACLSPAVSPDGRWAAYERHALLPGAAGAVASGEARIHLLSLDSGQDRPLGDDNPARFPRWGPDGRLSYFDVARQALVVQDLASGAVTYIPNTSGDIGTWSPDGQFIVFAEIFFPPEPTPDPARPEAEHTDRFYSHLLRATIATNDLQDLSGPGVVEDASPVYSPSGEWLAFARRGLGEGQWTPGRQLWLMRADGSQTHALTAEPFLNHSAFRWSPDGRLLAHMRLNAADPSQPAEVWIIQADGSGARRLAQAAYLPEWLP